MHRHAAAVRARRAVLLRKRGVREQGAADTKSKGDTNIRQMADPTSAVNINMGTLVGSYETVARMLDEVATVEGTSGVMLTFDDFIIGMEQFFNGFLIPLGRPFF